MANDLLTSDIINERIMVAFQNNLVFVRNANRDYENEFEHNTYLRGDSVRVRETVQYTVGEGQDITGSIQATTERFDNVVIDRQFHVALDFTQRELTLDINRFDERYLKPAGAELANQVDLEIGLRAETTINDFVGSPDTRINSYDTIILADTKLSSYGLPKYDRMVALSVADGGALRSSMQVNFNPTFTDTNIAFKGLLDELSGMAIGETQNIAVHIAGVGDSGGATAGFINGGDVVGAVASGSTIPVDGLLAAVTPGVFKKGDVIEIEPNPAGVFTHSVTPTGRTDTGNNMQFVVTADVASDVTGAATIPVSPAIISDPLSPYRNVTNPIPDDAKIKLADSHRVNVAWHKSGLTYAGPALDVPKDGGRGSNQYDADTLLNVRYVGDYSILPDKSINRVDTLSGIKWRLGGRAVRILSKI